MELKVYACLYRCPMLLPVSVAASYRLQSIPQLAWYIATTILCQTISVTPFVFDALTTSHIESISLILNASHISGIQSITSLEKYLGFPMLHGRSKRSDFNLIIEKMQARLASWNNKLLNRTGRVTLATSVLSSIPTYYMQINWLPQNICDSIDHTTRNFVWKGTDNKGIHLVNWQKVTKPKHMGGLGIQSARDANTSVGKHSIQQIRFWPNTLHATYNSSSSPSWSSIIKAKDILRNGYVWRAGSGCSSFLFNNWSSHGLLGSLVPIIDIHLTVRDVFHFNGHYTQALYTILPQPIAEFINNNNFRFNEKIDDNFIWKHNIDGVYTGKSGYLWLLG
ncbi:reverse transcriptase, putative [Medicago truncatula]|uniref:Reverse transcriptase, putative n=1 Tax=Medicago truncatula TaxID=3880 RepID=A0A072UF93_MEDTR|nr:reverse transcriptase, putative [Medicago truncatula]